jgi:opacity protein-like surface antigen
MLVRRVACLAALLAISASPALAEDDPPAYFDGAYLGVTNFAQEGKGFGYASGTATYHFLTDGYYNSSAGQTFSVGMPINEEGPPFGIFFGHNWQNGHRVFGVEAYFHTRDIRADDFTSPDYISTGNHVYDIKTHWLLNVSATAGVVFGRTMFYAEVGPAIGHPVAQIDDADNNYRIWTPRAVPGLAAGVGFEVALTQFLSVGVGYRAYMLAPLHVSGQSFDRATGDPVPGTETDHTIQITGHSITTRIVYRFGHSDRAEAWVGEPFQWAGFHTGIYLGSLHQIGAQFGYDWVRDNSLFGVSFQAGIGICCDISYDFALSARVGRIFPGNILGYAEITGAYQTGTFFGVIDGPYYGAGLGLEVALSRRMTGFIEAKLLGAPDRGFGDVYVQGGFNLALGRR